MSPARYFLSLLLAVCTARLTAQQDNDLLTRIKALEDPNDLWNLLKTASKNRPPDEDDIKPDFDDEDFFDDYENDDLFHSEEENDIKPVARNPDPRKLFIHLNGRNPNEVQPTDQSSQKVIFVRNQQNRDNSHYPGYINMYQPNGPQEIPLRFVYRRNKRSLTQDDPDEVQGTSLSFVFDTTGSMASELHQVQRRATELAKAMTAHPDKPIYNYVFVPFNDPDVGPVTRTTDHAHFQTILDGVRVNGGGDCPEMSMKGLIMALEQSRPKSFIYVFTDAGAKDDFLLDKVLSLIQRKQSMIVFLLTGHCYPKDREFYQIIAMTSGGQVYDLEKTDVNEVLEYIKKNLNSRKVSLLSLNAAEPAPHPKPYMMPVDGLLDEFTVSVSGKNPKLTVYEPNGHLAAPPKLKNMLNLNNLKVVNVKDPDQGEWIIKVGSDSTHSIRSTALSNSNIKFTYGFSVIPTTNLAETAHRPLQGTNNSLLVKTHLPTTICVLTHVKLIDFNGNTIKEIPLKIIDKEQGVYSGGPVFPPNEFFNMEAQGVDSAGNKLVRIFPSAIKPQLPDIPEVNVKSRVYAAPGGDINLECHVESLVPVTVKWYKDGALQSTVEFKQSSKSVLAVKNVLTKGKYTCWTSNIAGTLSKDIHLLLAEPPAVYVSSEVVQSVNLEARIPCQVDSEVAYNITWSRKLLHGSRSSNGGEDLRTLSRTPESKNIENDFIIDRLRIEDEGWYTCTASSKGGSNSGETYLRVQSPPRLEDVTQIMFTNGSPLVVTCKLSKADSTVRMKWERKDTPIKPDHTTIEGNEDNNYTYQLIVHSPNKADQGFYRCVASNQIGTEIKTVKVTFISKPDIKADNEEVLVRLGSPAQMRCVLQGGIPPAKVTWLKQGVEITNDTPNIQIMENGASLKILQTNQDDLSEYTCLAKNEAGHDSANVNLLAAVEAKILSPSSNGNLEVEYGSSLELPCLATGRPMPTLMWVKISSDGSSSQFYDEVLKLQDATLDDIGEYTCEAKNRFGKDQVSINITLSGLESPTINGRDVITDVKGLVGQKVELPCVLLSGSPIPNITWYKDGIRLSPSMYNNIVLSNGSFVIHVLTLRHIGNYECRAENAIGHDIKQYSLSIYDAPKMNLSLGSFILAKVGTNVSLPCHSRGDPQPVLTWHKESTASDRPNRGFRVNGSDSLYVHNVVEEDSGRYICKAENIAGIARKAVILSVISAPKIMNFPKEMSSTKGEVFFLSCSTQGTPRPTIRWLKDGKPLLFVRGSIGSNYLRFFGEPSDSGEYTCVAENKAGEDRATTYLMILEPPKMDQSSESQIEGVVGQDVEIPCHVTATPKPIVIWQYKGETIKKFMPSGNSSVNLHLSKVTEEQKGQYLCIASNKAGVARKIIELNVLVPPSIEDWNGPIKVVPGDTVTISCKVSGTPKPTVKWMKNGLPLSPEFFAHDNILRFIVESSHSGNYTCLASNKAGESSKDVNISVYEAPKFLLDQSEDLQVLEGSDVKLVCSARGDPKPVISWFYNGRLIDNKDNIRFFQDKDIMFIYKVNEEEEGIYECAATNKAGSNSRSIKIKVLVPPQIIKWTDDMSVREGNEVILSCDIKGKPDPIVVWKKNNMTLPLDLSYRGNKIRFIATAQDQGNYSCYASNKVGTDVKHTALTVKVYPQITGDEEDDIVVLWGDNLELKCEASGVPTPSISWNFNSTEVHFPNSALQLNGSNLFIPKVDFHNAGLYICFANNSLGTVKKTFRIAVHVAPTITDDSQLEIMLREGEDFSISCSAYGVPDPNIFWINNDKIYKKGYQDDHYVVMSDYTLIMSNAQLNMTGDYICVASNIQGSATKNYSIAVTVSPRDPIVEQGNVTLIEIEESDDGVLNCPLPQDSPVQWLKDDEGVDLAGNERADDVHLQLLDGGRTLKLAEAYSSDTGIYTCFSDTGLSAQFFVKVLVRPHFAQEFPVVDFELKQGDQLTLDCSAAGSPQPKINWRHVERNIPITRHTVPGVLVKGDEKDTLHFPSVKIHHAGRYMCMASNKVGREARVFTVIVTEPPTLVGEREEKLTAVSGNNLDLMCSVNGSPKPRYTWKHISTTGKETALRASHNILMINNLNLNDGGIYICNATNKVGSAIKYFFIFVLDAPRIKGGSVEEIYLPEGKEMEAECEASGVPLPSLTWQFENRPIDTTRAIITSTKPQINGSLTSTLRLKDVDQAVAGLYTCLASNDVGTAQKQFKLYIIVPPVLSDQSFIFTNKSFDVIEGQIIYLSCPVRQDQQIDIEWFKTANGTRQSARKQSNDNLYIAAAGQSDGGLYTCRAINSAGSVEASFIINISSAPVFYSNSYERLLTLNQDEELILNCSVNSKPRSQIIWLKDGVRITGKINSNLSLLNHNQTLIMSDIRAGDSGKYICIASNSAGSAERSFLVNIHEAPKIDGIMSGQISETSNKTETHFNRVTLRCPLTGSPQPTIEWYKDGLILRANERIHITPQGTKVIILYSTEEDAGHYSCRAQNQAGINQLFFNLKIIVPLEWTQWTEWSQCSKACDRGSQYRNRTCGEEPSIRTKQNIFVEYDRTACKGDNSETRLCNTHPCKVDGGWGVWSEWSSCSVSCGQGSRTRARRCDNPAPAFGGARCKGLHMETASCNRPSCPVDGQWSSWSEWSECTVSCGGGLKFRERRCNSPSPKDGGKPCPGSYRDVVICKQHKCPIDGRWTHWGKWSECSATCGPGVQIRYRHCYRPMYGGKSCYGTNKDVRKCEKQSCKNEAYAAALHSSPVNMVSDDTMRAVNTSHDHSRHYTSVETGFEVHDKSDFSRNEQPLDDGITRGKILYLAGAAPTLIERDLSSWNDSKPQESVFYAVNSSLTTDPQIQATVKQDDVMLNYGVDVYKDEFKSYNSIESIASTTNDSSNTLINSDEVSVHFKRIKCPSGFKHNKTSNHCQDINECLHKKWNRCRRYRSKCVNTIGSYRCVCSSGYRLSDDGHRKRCIDINECKEKIAKCSHFCHNSRGGYKCSCPDGLTLLEDTHTCLKDSSDFYDSLSSDLGIISEELSYQDSTASLPELSILDQNLISEPGYQMDSAEGAYNNKLDLICPKGFIKDGNNCKDINECSLDLHNCTPEQVCINTLGFYKCYDAPCPHDFDLIPSIRSCQHNCSSNSSQCSLGTKIAETVTYEAFDTENKTISFLKDIVLLIAYDENQKFINNTQYSVSSNEADLPIDVRKENNLGMVYTTSDFYLKDMHRVDILSVTHENATDTILYVNQFIIFIYNSYTIN